MSLLGTTEALRVTDLTVGRIPPLCHMPSPGGHLLGRAGMCQSHGTFPGVLVFRVGTPRVHTVPGSPLRDEEQAWKRPCSPDPEPGLPPHTGRRGGAFPWGFPQGAGVGSFLGSEKDIWSLAEVGNPHGFHGANGRSLLFS